MIAIAPSMQSNWDWRAAGNFVCGGTGSGLMVFAAAGGWLRLAHFEWVALGALLIVGCGLSLVWHEIGRRWRFLNVLRNPATSWMSREAWAASVLFGAGGIGVLLASPAWLSLAAAAAVVFLFCQAQMLRAARGIPAWRDRAIVPVVLSSGLSEGAGLLLAASALEGVVPIWLALSVVVLVVCRSAAMVWYALRLFTGRAPLAVLPRLRRTSAIVLGAGSIVPLVLLLIAASAFTVPCAVAAGLLTAVAGWQFKYTLVRGLACMQGFALKHAPARGALAPGIGARPGWQ